jgi:hypothetical protein
MFVAATIALGLNLTAMAAGGNYDIHDPNKLVPADVDSIMPQNAIINTLPKVSMQSAVTTIIKNILSFSFVITILALVVTGIYYLISEGNDEETGKAKKILLYLVIGMAIIGASYGIVSGITRFKLLE